MTTALQQVEALLPKMSSGEKSQLLKWVMGELDFSFPGIESTEGVCGGSACIVRTRVPVWTLVEAKKSGAPEAAILQAFPQLRAEDLANAWAYYRANKVEIDRAISENEAI